MLKSSQWPGPGRERGPPSWQSSCHWHLWRAMRWPRSGQREPSFCCCNSNSDGNWRPRREPVSPSSHLPISPKCPLLAVTQQEALWRGGERNGVWRAPAQVQKGGLRVERLQVNTKTREQRIWSPKNLGLVLVLRLVGWIAFEAWLNLSVSQFPYWEKVGGITDFRR